MATRLPVQLLTFLCGYSLPRLLNHSFVEGLQDPGAQDADGTAALPQSKTGAEPCSNSIVDRRRSSFCSGLSAHSYAGPDIEDGTPSTGSTRRWGVLRTGRKRGVVGGVVFTRKEVEDLLDERRQIRSHGQTLVTVEDDGMLGVCLDIWTGDSRIDCGNPGVTDEAQMRSRGKLVRSRGGLLYMTSYGWAQIRRGGDRGVYLTFRVSSYGW